MVGWGGGGGPTNYLGHPNLDVRLSWAVPIMNGTSIVHARLTINACSDKWAVAFTVSASLRWFYNRKFIMMEVYNDEAAKDDEPAEV